MLSCDAFAFYFLLLKKRIICLKIQVKQFFLEKKSLTFCNIINTNCHSR